MKRFKWEISLGFCLFAISFLVYLIRFAIFRDINSILNDLLGQLAFLPVYIFLSTIIIDQLLSKREKQVMLKKLNMIIGSFYSEVGITLINCFLGFDMDSDKIGEILDISSDWTIKKFENARLIVKNHKYKVESRKGNLLQLKIFISGEREFLLNLLGNPNLLEHETFSELLMAVFHLIEELTLRINLENLSDADYNHLSGDLKRAYTLIIMEWLSYMKHLKEEYPYLFSLAVDTNPFKKQSA
jgi:hypothetical protein